MNTNTNLPTNCTTFRTYEPNVACSGSFASIGEAMSYGIDNCKSFYVESTKWNGQGLPEQSTVVYRYNLKTTVTQ